MPRQKPKPARILVLASNPKNDLELSKEFDAIRQQLVRFPGKFNPQFSPTGRLSDLEDELLLFGPKFFHFCGHGEKEGHLIFQDTSLSPLAVTSRRLGSLFQSSRCKPHCVFLNCCYSHVHARAIARHVRYAIGIDGAIGDGSAIEFSILFYRSLVATYTVPEAFNMALTALADTAWSNLPKLFTQQTPKEAADRARDLAPAPPFGNRAEVESVRNWIINDRCHLVLLTMPTLRSQTALTDLTDVANRVLVTLDLEQQFDRVIRATLPVSASGTEVIQALLDALPRTRDISSASSSLVSLLASLQVNRYLLLLDTTSNFGNFTEVIRALAQSHHNSCILIIGSSTPFNLAQFQGIDSIRSIILSPPSSDSAWSSVGETRDSLAETVRRASRVSLLRAEEKLRARDQRAIVPISRPDTQPHFQAFLDSARPLLLLLGDSGTGKSTLLLELYREPPHATLALFYDSHRLDEQQSLTHAIAADFGRPDYDLDDLLDSIHASLLRSSKKLLIIVDGLNETRTLRRTSLRSELERISSRLPATVKIVCSCRKVFWDVFLANLAPLSRELYFGSREFILERFSAREAEAAFASYAQFFDLRTSFKSLSHELRERLRDPLMLRLCAEGYHSKELPQFAPAVLIFGAYEEQLRRRLSETPLPAFLDTMVSLKAKETVATPSSDIFSVARLRRNSHLRALTQMQSNASGGSVDPLLLLEDEGVIAAVNAQRTHYRFTFDRFFEFLLGKNIGHFLQETPRPLFVERLRKAVLRLSPRHYSFLQALKAELIRLNIENPHGPWTLYNPETLRQLLESDEPDLVTFMRDLLRELAFEGPQDLFVVISDLYGDRSRGHLLILDIAPDSAKALPLALAELLTSSAPIARRCCRILAGGLRDSAKALAIEECLLGSICTPPLVLGKAKGLIYYTAALFAAAHDADLDPLPMVKQFWMRAWIVLQQFSDAFEILAQALAQVIRVESPLFFGESAGDGIDYFWKALRGQEKALAVGLIPYLENPALPLSPQAQEVMLFFGSSVRNWPDRTEPKPTQTACYKIEYRIAQWLLVQRCRSSYSLVRKILNTYVDTGNYKSIDFSLGVMELCCLFQLREAVELDDAYNAMLDWTARLRRDDERFFWCLSQPDPLAVNQCPPDMAGRVSLMDRLSPTTNSVPFLEQWLVSRDLRDVQMGIIAARNMWSYAPAKVLGSLDIVAHKDDTLCRDWVERVLREVYLIYPRLVEDFFARNHFTAGRIARTKHRQGVVDPSAAEHPGHLLMIPLFLGPRDRLAEVGQWYRRLHNAPSLEFFGVEFLKFFLAKLMNGPELH